jgi:hypothetical protein
LKKKPKKKKLAKRISKIQNYTFLNQDIEAERRNGNNIKFGHIDPKIKVLLNNLRKKAAFVLGGIQIPLKYSIILGKYRFLHLKSRCITHLST